MVFTPQSKVLGPSALRELPPASSACPAPSLWPCLPFFSLFFCSGEVTEYEDRQGENQNSLPQKGRDIVVLGKEQAFSEN